METVLIVEDDRVYARATTNWLVKNGINARYVLSVDNAKEFLDNHDVDLVLSDFRLDNGILSDRIYYSLDIFIRQCRS